MTARTARVVSAPNLRTRHRWAGRLSKRAHWWEESANAEDGFRVSDARVVEVDLRLRSGRQTRRMRGLHAEGGLPRPRRSRSLSVTRERGTSSTAVNIVDGARMIGVWRSPGLVRRDVRKPVVARDGDRRGTQGETRRLRPVGARRRRFTSATRRPTPSHPDEPDAPRHRARNPEVLREPFRGARRDVVFEQIALANPIVSHRVILDAWHELFGEVSSPPGRASSLARSTSRRKITAIRPPRRSGEGPVARPDRAWEGGHRGDLQTDPTNGAGYLALVGKHLAHTTLAWSYLNEGSRPSRPVATRRRRFSSAAHARRSSSNSGTRWRSA